MSSSSPPKPRSLKRLSQNRTVSPHSPIRAAITSCVRQVQQIDHGADGGLVQIKSSIPLFDRNPPSLRPDLPSGRAPRAAAVKDAAAIVAAPAEPARSVLDRASPALD